MISGGLNKIRPGLICCLLLLMSATAASGLTISWQDQLNLADRFFEQEEYAAAAIEYHRFIFFFPDVPQADYALFRIGLARFLNNEIESAVTHFERLFQAEEPGRYAIEAAFMLSRCYLKTGQPETAAAVLTALAASREDIDVRDRALYHLGWVYLESAAVPDAGVIDRAKASFAAISDENRDIYRVKDLTEGLQYYLSDREGPLLSRKSPALAGTLAVIPGAGYVYCGRYQDALMSFLFNAGMGCAACEAFDNDLEALGAVIGVVGLGFYLGNIYGSVSAAHKYNRTLSRSFFDRLGQIRVSLIPLPKEDGAGVSVRVPF